MHQLLNELEEQNVGSIKANEPLSNHTTIKIGGPADLFVEPASIEDLKRTLKLIKKYQVPWRTIGRGSNLLVSDKGIEGVVIKLGKSLDEFKVNDTEIIVGAGYSFIVLANVLSRQGLKGLEFAGGIPGSIGGAVYMNAGAHGSEISNVLTNALILFPDGSMEWLSKDDLGFSYRTSILQKSRPGIVVKAQLKLEKGDKETITKKMQEHKHYRKKTQPWNLPCAGSIFRNPLPDYAGKLVEKAGLRGHKIGGAQISKMHGNFIVNTGDAKADDVFSLIEHVKNTIFDKYQINLETEVEIIDMK
ncbi:UDP-N-acetylmuramate dehydrogenase [Bacillus pakistanensis]|uniref:UDP-N-acetylmuramate dehydrogenase n=1 Tax=Rossellomorea pakistanensis TaxID=992288 RepID=UPI001964348D